MLFSDLESFLFPINVCGIPFLGRGGHSSTNYIDLKKDDDTDETNESHEPLLHEPLSCTKSFTEPLRPTTVLMPRACTTDTKQVRFAIDDENVKRKRRQRNLRKSILQKSVEQRHSNNDAHDGMGNRSVPSSPGGSCQRSIASSSKSQAKRHGRHRKKNHMALLIGPSNH